MRVVEAQSRAEARVTEQKGRSDALVSAVSEQAQARVAEAVARVAEAVARAEAAEAALAVAEADAARSMGPRLQRAPYGFPPVQRPTRLLRAILWTREEGPRRVYAEGERPLWCLPCVADSTHLP